MIWKELVYNYIKNNKILILVYLIIVFFTFPVESVILPTMYSKLFESIRINYKKLPTLSENILQNIKNISSTGIIWIIIFTWISVVFFYNLKNKYEAKIAPKYLSFIRKKIFSKTIENHSTNFSELKVGEHITRILDVSRNMKDILTFMLTDIFPLTIAIMCIISYFLYINLKSGIIMLIGVIISVILVAKIGKKCINKSAEREKYYLKMSEKINDSFGNLMNIYLNNETNKEIKRNDEIDKKHTQSFENQLLLTKDLIGMLSVVSVLTFIAVLIITYGSLKEKKISQGYFISIVIILIYYLGYLIKVSNNIPQFLNKIGIVKNSKIFLERILKENKNINQNYKIEKGNIIFKNVYFRYPKTQEYILKKINFQIKDKDKVAIIGPSGSGKSTIMKLILRMNNIDKGEILIDNVNIKQIPVSYLRKKIIYVNQKTNLFNTNIIDNILYGNYDVNYNDVLNVIKKYNLNTVYNGLHKGIYESTGVNGANLSLGMQKVTIILRGIFKKGKIIIFDEPLAGLDSITRKKIMNLIKDKCKDKTVIIITHDKEIIPYCNYILNMDKIKKIIPINSLN